jgi:hypothetical protein
VPVLPFRSPSLLLIRGHFGLLNSVELVEASLNFLSELSVLVCYRVPWVCLKNCLPLFLSNGNRCRATNFSFEFQAETIWKRERLVHVLGEGLTKARAFLYT